MFHPFLWQQLPERHAYVHLLCIFAERIPRGINFHKHDVTVSQRWLWVKRKHTEEEKTR